MPTLPTFGRRPYHAGLVGLSAGLVLAATEPSLALPLAAVALVGLAAVRAAALGVVCAALLLAGAGIGAARLDAIDAPGRSLHPGLVLSGRAELVERPRRTRFGSQALLRLRRGPGSAALVLARGEQELHWPAGLDAGAEVRFRGLVQRPRRRPGGRFDFAAQLRRRGVAGELTLSALRATGRRRVGLAGALDALRSRAERAVSSGLDPQGAELLRGMVLGQDERIGAATRDDWRRSGLAHLLAVSGQNVVLLLTLASLLFAPLGLARNARLALMLGLIAIYVPLAGAGPSIQRAGVMGAAGALALAASRPASRSYGLLLAAAVTLALNPRSIGEPGWQLSFAAVAGIVWISPSLRRALGVRAGPLRRAVSEGVAVAVAATVATAPLLVHHFGAAPLASLPANLLALPAVAPVMWLGMLKAAVGQLAVLGQPLAPAGDRLVEALGLAARVPLAYLGAVAEHFAALPLPRLSPPLETAPALLGAYAVLIAALAAIRIATARSVACRDAAAARWRELPRVTRRFATAACCAGALSLALATLALPRPPQRLTVSFLDVGQGDATLIQDAAGATVLFDGGPPEANIARLLRSAGVRRLALIVATHASRDHHEGLRELLRRFPVGVLLDGGDGTRDPTFRALLDEAAARGVRCLRGTAPLSLRIGSLAVRVLGPPPRPRGPPPANPNARAIVALVSAGDFDLLLSADAESDALSSLRLPDVDAIKVPHHGSADPGLPGLLRRLRPEVAAIEVGAGNSYGHPAPSTLAALGHAGVATYRTDRDGTIKLTADHGRLAVETER